MDALTAVAGRPITDFPTTKDQVELTYRLARIYDKSGMQGEAIKNYNQTIKSGDKLTYYFAANSCLHNAYIYEDSNDYTLSEKYYKKCLKMRGHEYQNSIDQKAKAGLQRIKLKQKQ